MMSNNDAALHKHCIDLGTGYFNFFFLRSLTDSKIGFGPRTKSPSRRSLNLSGDAVLATMVLTAEI